MNECDDGTDWAETTTGTGGHVHPTLAQNRNGAVGSERLERRRDLSALACLIEHLLITKPVVKVKEAIELFVGIVHKDQVEVASETRL